MELDEIVLRAIPMPTDACHIVRAMTEHKRMETKKRIEEYIKGLSLTSNVTNDPMGEPSEQDGTETH